MSLTEKLLKNSKNKANILADSPFFNDEEMVETDIPILNIALSGEIHGGLTSGTTMVAGPSKHFKTSICLLMIKAYLEKYPDAILLFYDTEFGSPSSYFESFNIDTNRIIHTPITNIEELKFDIMNQLEQIEEKDKVIIFLDSIGNIASKKEVEDALEEKSVADMTRAKTLKGLFRMITPVLKTKKIPCLAVNHSYQTQEMFSKTVVSGGCLVKDTEITMEDGSLKPIQDVKIGDFVQTINGTNEVTATWNPDTLEDGIPECFEIEFEDGYSIQCSDNHRFLNIDNRFEYDQWIEAQNLKVNDEISRYKNTTLKITKVQPIGKRQVYDVSVQDAEHYILQNGVITHNTGPMYSSDTVFIIGRQQEKTGTEVTGYNFIINIEKSRFTREKSKLPLKVTFDGGIEYHSGLLEVALEGGYVIKPNKGWYVGFDPKTETELTKKYREKNIDKNFFSVIFENTDFSNWIERRYKIANSKLVQEKDEETETQTIEEEENGK